jgi:ribosomal 50S subunit-recycling heat shock protein
MSEEAVRADVWLWRARFFKSRSAAAKLIDEGRVRWSRDGARTRLDKPARLVKPGDELVFAVGGRAVAVRVAALGFRRGPPTEARALYTPLEDAADAATQQPDAHPGRA